MRKRIILLTFFALLIGIFPKIVFADFYCHLNGSKIPIGDYIYGSFSDEFYPIELYLTDYEQEEISLPYNAQEGGFLVTDNFIPNKYYYFTRVKVKTDKGEEFYSFVEDGKYPYYNLPSKKILIMERSISKKNLVKFDQ